eukprot:2500795-Heterocapsa_arctica.AAC.1
MTEGCGCPSPTCNFATKPNTLTPFRPRNFRWATRTSSSKGSGTVGGGTASASGTPTSSFASRSHAATSSSG